MARTIAKDHGEKRALILRSAAKVFATEGYDRASMAQLARECGISKANIYHYYTGKDALLYDILESYLRNLRDRLCVLELEGPPHERLRRIAAEILLAHQGMDYEHQIQTAAMATLSRPQQDVLRGYQRDMVALVSGILSAASATLAADPTRLRATTMSVFGMLNWFYTWNSHAGAEARLDYAALVADLTINGLAEN